MHGSALGEARHATSIGRAILQFGVYLQELLTAFVSPSGVVGVSANTQRDNPFVRQIIPNAVDTTIFRPDPIGKTPHPTIVFVGAVDGRKRGRFLLDIFARAIRPAFPNAELTFVGPGAPAGQGVTSVTGVSDADLASLYRRAWVAAVPSTYEGFGLPCLEAMSCGTAVIATPNPGSREVLGENYGGLVEDEEFASGVLKLLADEGRRRAFEIAGIRRASEFSIDRMIDQYEALLSGLRGSHARSVASA
jgi:glycosyltransferase involved in cell wall biosynthesis